MKKFSLLLLLAVCFFLVVAQKYSAEETAAANLVRKANVINGLNDSSLIFPNQMLVYPFPKDEDRWFYCVREGDQQLRIAKQLLFGDFKMLPIDTSWTEFKPQKPVVVLPVVEKTSYRGLAFGLLLCVLALLAALIYVEKEAAKDRKKGEEAEKLWIAQKKFLEKELVETINKLPINPPPTVDGSWLEKNNPVGSDLTNHPDFASATIARIYGKMPDLVVRALVSTGENAISMNFSHGRKANTGLKNVAIYLGWNWDEEKSQWTEVGMIASVCTNGFQVSPEKVTSINELFTNFELVGSDQHPVVYQSKVLPKNNFRYPALIHGLIMQYHGKNIADLNRIGVVVVPKANNEEKKYLNFS